MAGAKEMAKSWKTWATIAGAIITTIVLFEKAQPYVEGYAAKELAKEVMDLKVQVYDLKKDVNEGFARMEIIMAENEHKMDKELIKATIEAVRNTDLARNQ